MSKFEHLYVTKQLAPEDSGLGSNFAPSPEHMKIINKYTLESVSTEQVIALPIRAMNDRLDRDMDRFTEVAIDKLAKNKSEKGPLGKPFLLSHYPGDLANGRIYMAEKETIGNVNHLKLWVYVPNTPQYQDFIENIMFGVYWAVSVGVGTDKTACTVCGTEWDKHYMMECENGHMKGQKYEGTMCWRDIGAVTELYELSSVYLGAQYGAEVAKKMIGDKGKSLDIIRKAIQETDLDVSDQESEKEIEDIYKGKEWPEILSLCKDAFLEGESDKWGELESKCSELGKIPPWKNEKVVTLVGEGAKLEPMDDGSLKISKGTKVWLYDGDKIYRSEVKHVANEIERLTKELEVRDAEVDALDVKVKEATDALGESKDVNAQLVKELETTKDELESKSKIVDSYLDGLKNEAIKWYKMSKGEVEGDIDTSSFVRLLDKCSDDPEMLMELIGDYEERAKAIMPPEVRRSSNEDSTGIEEESAEPESDSGVANSIHG